jgi:hypothetical protein
MLGPSAARLAGEPVPRLVQPCSRSGMVRCGPPGYGHTAMALTIMDTACDRVQQVLGCSVTRRGLVLYHTAHVLFVKKGTTADLWQVGLVSHARV